MLCDPTATIELHRLLVKAPRNAFILAELQQVVGRLAQIAEGGHPGALFRMGELLEAEGTQAKHAKASECYRRAGEKGVGDAWVRLGRLQAKGGKKEEAEASFKKGKRLGMFFNACSRSCTVAPSLIVNPANCSSNN